VGWDGYGLGWGVGMLGVRGGEEEEGEEEEE
jgi:hypothetical protein